MGSGTVRAPDPWPSPPPAFRVFKGELDKWIKLAAIRIREQAIAVSWLKSNPKLTPREVAELKAFRTEAESLLHTAPRDLPKNVFAPANPTDFPKS